MILIIIYIYLFEKYTHDIDNNYLKSLSTRNTCRIKIIIVVISVTLYLTDKPG